MAEEQEEKGGGSFKNILIGLASTIALGVGGYVTKQLTGEGDEPAPTQQAAPVININQAAAQPATNKTVIVNGGGNGGSANAKPAEPKPATPVKKKEGDEFKEKPAQW